MTDYTIGTNRYQRVLIITGWMRYGSIYFFIQKHWKPFRCHLSNYYLTLLLKVNLDVTLNTVNILIFLQFFPRQILQLKYVLKPFKMWLDFL